MTKSHLLWDLWIRSKTLRVRPSELVQERDPIAAWNLDGAVMHFGLALEQELQKVEEKDPKKADAQRDRILRKWLPEAFKASGSTGFRDPAKEM